jgi:hypothetical protein
MPEQRILDFYIEQSIMTRPGRTPHWSMTCQSMSPSSLESCKACWSTKTWRPASMALSCQPSEEWRSIYGRKKRCWNAYSLLTIAR